MVLGQNEHIAWGFTNTGPDVQDLYLERFKPDDPMQVQTPGGWERLASVSEDIHVKGAKSENLVVRVSRHGPMISDAGGAAGEIAGNDGNAALRHRDALDRARCRHRPDRRGAGDEPRATRPPSSSMQRRACGWRRCRTWWSPIAKAQIAVVSPGRVPLRKTDHDLKGLVPAPGWDARYDWDGFVPAAQTPREAQPPRGWIATANQRIHGSDYPHYLTSEWAPPYRQQRIEQLLRSRAKHSIDDMAAMQADVLSLATQRLLPWLQRARSEHALAGAAQAALKNFNGEMKADASAPLIFWAWSRQLVRAVFTDELGGPEVYERVLGARSFRDALEGVLERNDAWWCDDKTTTDEAETCEQMSDVALTRALDELQQRFGADVSKPGAGATRMWRAASTGRSRASRRWRRCSKLRVPSGGDSYTVNVGRVGVKPDATTGELYLNEHAPSLRAIYDLGDLSQSTRHAFDRAVGPAVAAALPIVRGRLGAGRLRAAVGPAGRAGTHAAVAALNAIGGWAWHGDGHAMCAMTKIRRLDPRVRSLDSASR